MIYVCNDDDDDDDDNISGISLRKLIYLPV